MKVVIKLSYKLLDAFGISIENGMLDQIFDVVIWNLMMAIAQLQISIFQMLKKYGNLFFVTINNWKEEQVVVQARTEVNKDSNSNFGI